jgi:hypothetical protein
MRPTWLDSVSEMPGRRSMEIVSVPSLKGGSKNERASTESPFHTMPSTSYVAT